MISLRLALAIVWPLAFLFLAIAVGQSMQARAIYRRARLVPRADFSLPAITEKPQRRFTLYERWSAGPAAAALRLRVGEYVVFRVLSFLVPFLVGLFVRGLVGGVLLGLVGLAVVTMYFRMKQSRWLKEAEEALPEFLRAVSSALRAGSSLSQAMALVAGDTPGPLGDEVRRVLRREALGFSIAETLSELSHRIPSRDLGLAVMAISIQREVGGSLADVLDNIVQTIDDRQRLKSEVRVLTAQGRYSGWLLTVLPFGLGLLLWFTDPHYTGLLLTTHLGWAMLGGAALLVGMGGLIINRLVQTPEM
ncbi:MAG: type II secretion system protein F [Sulfobacillus acidophilus]|uniref:Type II secretion system protein F n=1 Tax=Sulfobacillus acidophilus TaxID=53633 RepID=A0A2T2WNW4_9FIRM|nr:MAG: type II secretion system protein F [Sulfobacillus acidophilus]